MPGEDITRQMTKTRRSLTGLLGKSSSTGVVITVSGLPAADVYEGTTLHINGTISSPSYSPQVSSGADGAVRTHRRLVVSTR